MPDNTAATFGGVGGQTRLLRRDRRRLPLVRGPGRQSRVQLRVRLVVHDVPLLPIALRGSDTGDITVNATITNTGTRPGADTMQVYVGDPRSTGEPPRQLRGYQRVQLAPGASDRVALTLTPGDLAWWNSAANTWQVTAGEYDVWVGDGSDVANLPLHALVYHGSAVLGPHSGPTPPAPGA